MKTGVISKLRKGFEEWEERVTMTYFLYRETLRNPVGINLCDLHKNRTGFVWGVDKKCCHNEKSQDGQIYENHKK